MMMDFDMFLAELGLDKMLNLIELEAMKERAAKDQMDYVLEPAAYPFKIAPTNHVTDEQLDALVNGAYTEKQVLKHFKDQYKAAKAWAEKRAKK